MQTTTTLLVRRNAALAQAVRTRYSAVCFTFALGLAFNALAIAVAAQVSGVATLTTLSVAALASSIVAGTLGMMISR